MQPFGAIKNPKINVQTKKQPPVHRYPVPYSVNQPTVPATGSSGMPPKITKGPFAEDSSKMLFDPSQTFESQTEFSVTEHNQERNRTPSQTHDDFGNDLHSHHKGHSLEVTPASFGKGQKLEESPIKDTMGRSLHESEVMHNPEFIKKGITPEKRAIGMKDDDEYVRMASADEEEDDEPIVRKTKERILPAHKAKIDAPRRYQDEDAPTNFNKSNSNEDSTNNMTIAPNLSQFEDTNALLKIKRLELELAKEKNKNEFLDSEQIKLINENTELKRRVEELHARADLAEKYDNRERLAKKEEEAERLKLEVNRLVDENRILEAYSQKVLQANAVYRQESDSLIASQQAEKRRFMEELHSLKRQLEERENPSNILKERNEILESQLYELRQQVSLLTNQLALKAETNQKMNNFTEEIQSIVSTLSNVTIQTQTQTSAHYSQHAQTSPVKFAGQFPVTTIDTQTPPAQTDSHHAQTSPLIVENVEKSHVSPTKIHPVQSPFIQQKSPESHPVDNVHNVVSAFQSSPPKAENYAPHIGSTEKVQHVEDITPPQNVGYEAETQVHNILASFEESKVSPVKEQQHFEQEIEGPPKAEFHPIEQEISHHHQAPVEIPTSIPHQHEEDHPPIVHPPQHTQISAESAEHGMLASFNTSETNDKVSGTSLIAPPKYKIPVRPIPKKAVPGFKPMTHHANPFSEQGPAAHPEQNTDFGVTLGQEKNNEPELPPQHISQPIVEVQPEPQQIMHNVQVEEPVHVEQPQHIEQQAPVQEPVVEEKIEAPPRGVVPSGTNAPPAFRPFVAGRPPVSMIPKAKVQKIGKNPFSSENESESSSILDATASQNPSIETRAHQQNVVSAPQYEHTTGIVTEDLAKSFAQDQGAAENFFDQLGQNPSQTIDDSKPINNYTSQDASTSDLMKSFQTESGLSAEKGAEVNKPPVTKAVPIKKKKAALPSNMFD